MGAASSKVAFERTNTRTASLMALPSPTPQEWEYITGKYIVSIDGWDVSDHQMLRLGVTGDRLMTNL